MTQLNVIVETGTQHLGFNFFLCYILQCSINFFFSFFLLKHLDNTRLKDVWKYVLYKNEFFFYLKITFKKALHSVRKNSESGQLL